MNKDLMEMVLPRLASRLHKHLQRYYAGELDQAAFAKNLEGVLRRHHRWLSGQGVPEADAAIAIHASLVILSGPGLREEADEEQLPLEVIEFRALRSAAEEISQQYDVSPRRVLRQLCAIVAQYAE